MRYASPVPMMPPPTTTYSMLHLDAPAGTVTYTKTKMVEDDSFLEAAEQLKESLPGRLGQEFLLGAPGN